MRGHSHRVGRAARKRRRKRSTAIHSASLSHQPQYVRLMKFLHQRGFTSTFLQPALFSARGAGHFSPRIMSSHNINGSEQLPGTVYQELESPSFTSLGTLCLSGLRAPTWEGSDWFPYIDVLPSSYTCPAYFSDAVLDVLPVAVRRWALEQREAVREMHSSNQEFFRTLQPVLSQRTEDVLTYDALRWAWCSVNTRSVFMPRPSNSFLSGPDNYALAPFLDLLNHRPDVQVKAGFNNQTKCYEIRCVCGIQRYEQAFINYGPHDNQRLLLEYGFVTMSSPHSVVYVETDLICDVLRDDKSLDQKMKFLKENNFLHNLTVSSEGPSWRLMVALRLLSLPQTLHHLWRAALHGQVVGEKTEARSNQTARTLCQQLLKDTQMALDEILHLLAQCGQPDREQLEVVKALRKEEMWILECCVKALKDSVHLDDEMSSCKANLGAMS